ncbi:DUF2339 domain-containing protein, partial [Candidatus Peregrinibacteria bacterium]|nr:DUF2339 domain-containing protein [Candidatus Peregrinibacteria bacterium]
MEWIAIIVLAIVVIAKSSRIKKIEERVSETREQVSSLRVKLEKVRLSVEEQKVEAIKSEAPKPPPVVTPAVTTEAFKESPPPKPEPPPAPVIPKREYAPTPIKKYEPIFTKEKSSPAALDTIKQYLSNEKDKGGGLETFLGTKVLNKLGVVILVFGIVFLIGYYVQHTGKWSKLLAGGVSGVGLIGLGVYLERKELFRKFAQPLIGGGWAVLYFTVYASHHIEKVKVLDDPTVAIGLLLGVAVGMIVHSLKYKSQVLTLFAYLLAFAAIWISDVTFSTLLYVLPLSASLIFLQIRFGWDILSFAGQIISYILYGLWASTYVVEIGSIQAPGPHFVTSLALLTGLWLIYQIPFYFVKEASKQLLLRYIGQAINTVLYAIAFCVQLHRIYPDKVYLFLVIYSVVQAGHAIFQRKRDTGLSYQFYVVPSAILLAIGLAYKYSHYDLSWSWLAEAEA